MAGAGYKLFATGDVLTAAEVNTYLQQQVTMVFANSTARTTALSGVLAEGMMSYLQDTNTVEVYNGSNWVNVGNTGDVTEVQAGTGISVADGTGPIPIVTNTMATEITAKGDLIVGTGSGTFDNLPAGTNGYTLVADSVETTGLKWVAPAGGGKVLQVVSATTTTEVQSTSSTYASTGISASITPSSATSKVLVLVSTTVGKDNGSSNNRASFRLRRASTTVLSAINVGYTVGQTFEMIVAYAASYLDSPATTSATTYTLEFNSEGNTSKVFVQNNSGTGSIVLLEIGA